MVEHLDNPGQFLTHLNDRLGHLYDRIIIIVPNAFSSVAQRAWRNGIENVNSDHRFWFSPHTIARLTTAAGFKVEKVHIIGEDRGWFFYRGLTINSWQLSGARIEGECDRDTAYLLF